MAVHQINGHWYLSITINKKRIRKAIKEAQTRRQAEKAERILRNEIYENRFGIGGQKLFAEFVEKSYKPYAKEHKKGYSVECSVLNVLIKRFGKYRLCEITPEEVETFKRHRATEFTLRKTIRSKATVNRDVAVLSAVFNLAKDFGEIKENPVSNVKYYGNLPSRERILSDDEETMLFDRIHDKTDLSRKIEILLYTGMRRGELFKIEWRDIDLANGFINIRKEITKTGKARIIPMLSNVKDIFESLHREVEQTLPLKEIFLGAESQAGKLSKHFRDVCSELGFNDLTIHSLRHTFSTRADKYKVGAFAQKMLLGHSKLSMTDRYTHVSKETLRENLDGFEQYLIQRKDKNNLSDKANISKTPNLLEFKRKT
jgi:integrase